MGLLDWRKTKKHNAEPKQPPKTAKEPAQVKDGGKKSDGAEKASMKELYDAKTGASAGEPGKGAVPKIDGKKRGHAYRLIIKPLITERAANLSAENKYVFEVAPKANKIEIAGAIRESYGVKPKSVNIVNVMGKNVRHGRIRGRRKDWKKAIVTLPAGQTINIYEGV